MVGKYLYESHVPWQNYKSQHTLAKTKSDNTNTFAHHCRCYSVQRTKLSLFRGMILIFLFLTAQKALKVTFLYGARRKFSVQLIDGENAFELNNFGGMVIFLTSTPLPDHCAAALFTQFCNFCKPDAWWHFFRVCMDV